MGAVYEASDLLLRTRVALKVLPGGVATTGTAMERFRREVLLARRVSHYNVCRVYELYDASADRIPIHFLTMELLEGETLSQRIGREGALSMAEAYPLVRQLCEGLAAAHAEGVIHRDFKSSNVMLVSRGQTPGESTTSPVRIVITDFGLARPMHLGGEDALRSAHLTGADVIGTPAYMAPEQVTGGKVTKASDIYALGVVLFEMVTGELPFTGETALAVAAKRLQNPPPRPERIRRGLDPRWSSTILRCMARDPERRFRSALDVLRELERRPRRWSRPVRAGAVGVAVLVAAVALFRSSPSPPSPAVSTPPPATLGHAPPEASPAVPSVQPPEVQTGSLADPARKTTVAPTRIPSHRKPRPPEAPPTGPPGTLVLTVSPWGEVFIDGKSYGEQVGRSEYPLPPGTHQVEVKGPSSWGPKQILIQSLKPSAQAVRLE